MSIADLRREYSRASLTENDVDPHPIHQFGRWFEEARAADVDEPTAMTLATATAGGRPSARMVLLKGVDDRGFVFYTDYRSRKGEDLAANPYAALVFYWPEIERQIRVSGHVDKVSREESEAYFRTRPLGSRLGAWTSHQSAVLPNRAALEERLRQIAEEFKDGDVPLPPYWGGYRVAPDILEFWQGRPNRLHDRIRYTRQSDGRWLIERLAP